MISMGWSQRNFVLSDGEGEQIYRLAYLDDDDMMNAMVFTDSKENIIDVYHTV